jgi:hypothetical protein
MEVERNSEENREGEEKKKGKNSEAEKKRRWRREHVKHHYTHQYLYFGTKYLFKYITLSFFFSDGFLSFWQHC